MQEIIHELYYILKKKHFFVMDYQEMWQKKFKFVKRFMKEINFKLI